MLAPPGLSPRSGVPGEHDLHRLLRHAGARLSLGQAQQRLPEDQDPPSLVPGRRPRDGFRLPGDQVPTRIAARKAPGGPCRTRLVGRQAVPSTLRRCASLPAFCGRWGSWRRTTIGRCSSSGIAAIDSSNRTPGLRASLDRDIHAPAVSRAEGLTPNPLPLPTTVFEFKGKRDHLPESLGTVTALGSASRLHLAVVARNQQDWGAGLGYEYR